MSAIYFAIPTDAGQAKIANALALGVPLKITHMAVGDGNGQPVTPNAAQTALVREKRRAPINTLFQDPTNQSQLVAEQIIPENVGDWWIREAGIFSEDGTLIAIANTPDTYKPLLSSGAGRTQVIRIVLIVSDTSAVELKIDPAVVLATRKYVDDLMAAHKQSRDHPDASETAKGFTRYATQVEVNETVTANQKANAVVTVKTLWGWVKQASETVLGLMKVATQAQTDAGTDDASAITPKKMRNGFSYSTLASGWYILFPSWLGGLVVQGGPVAAILAGQSVVITMPIAWPKGALKGLFTQPAVIGDSTVPISFCVDPQPGGNQFTIRNRSTASSGNSYWFAFGF
ncbi:phage tail protein [Aeromonas sp. ASNIH2]|uniref:phage tail protein n=1 Tax=Aeromonas sp. ASNIH2 TaxID=1636607 RepID=UPI000CDBEA3E|nr:phage tail protein [Aeromonas sp. ASNIH2]AUY08137.1 DNA inversion product [Aeromonas sp. ASNIH2]